jgi:hypothetical protein
VTWIVAVLGTLLAMWTLAPSIMALQSIEQHATPPGSPGWDVRPSLRRLTAGQHSTTAAAAAAATPSSSSFEPPESRQLQVAQAQQLGKGAPNTTPFQQAQDSAATQTVVQQVLQLLLQQLQEQQQAQQQVQQQQAQPQLKRPADLTTQHQQQPQQQQQQQLQPELDPLHGLPADLVQQLGLVDVVYLWVNGSDPVLTQELRQLAANKSSAAQPPPAANSHMLPVGTDDPLRMARFDAGRDELRYSLRSLEMHMPWFRNVYIVTNGQVRPAC